jgi:hypothetical protein
MKIRSGRQVVRAALAARVRQEMELRFLGGRGLRVTSQAGHGSGAPCVVDPGPRGIAPIGARGAITGSKGRPGSRWLCRRPPLPAPALPGPSANGSLTQLHDRQEDV